MTNVRPDFSLNPMAALVVAFNTVAEVLDLRTVTKFTDKPTAVARLGKILDQVEAEGYIVSYLPNGAISTITPASESQTLESAIVDGPASAAPKERGVRTSGLMGRTIELVTAENPKREKSRTRARYALYHTGMTTDQYMAQCLSQGLGTKREILSDLHHDSTIGFIKLS